jgi:putative colanic acid biosynthesis acetyltransferase WcaF
MTTPERVGVQQTVRLDRFDNAWYTPGRSLLVRVLWMALSRFVLATSLPWPSVAKRALLRAFGASVGTGVVVKPSVRVKYPWHLSIGDNAWIGEGVWLDSLGPVTIGANACLSQGVMVETGNHDWTKPTFDLIVRGVVIEDGAWAAVRSLLLPGAHLSSHAVLGAGSVLSGPTEPYGIYVGVPARKVKDRVFTPSEAG